eukprot:gene34065-44014_t
MATAYYSPSSSPPPLLTSFSPKSEKIVDVCKNCTYSFRSQFSSDTTDFCSKDCQTSYTLRGSNNSGSQKSNNRTIAEVKRSIYEFQNELENMDRRRAREQESKEQQLVHDKLNEEAYEKLFKPKIQKSNNLQSNQQHNFLFGWSTPCKPLRPQLQKFF